MATSLTAGAAGKSAPAHGWLGGFGRWNARQSHLAGQLDGRPVARTSAWGWFRLTKSGFMLLIPWTRRSRMASARVAWPRYSCQCETGNWLATMVDLRLKRSSRMREHAAKERASLVPKALEILRAYIVAGMPDQKLPPFGRFEDWSDLIRNTLVWFDMPAPCETRRHLEDADPVRDELRAVLSAWHEAFGHTLMTPFRRRQLPPERLRGPVYQPKIARFPAPGVHPRTPSAAPSLRNTIESPIR